MCRGLQRTVEIPETWIYASSMLRPLLLTCLTLLFMGLVLYGCKDSQRSSPPALPEGVFGQARYGEATYR